MPEINTPPWGGGGGGVLIEDLRHVCKLSVLFRAMHHNPFIFQEFEIDPGLITEQKAEVENKVRVLDSSFRRCFGVCYFNFYIFGVLRLGLFVKRCLGKRRNTELD